MKKIGNLLDKRKLTRKSLDQEGIFYVFKQLIREEYGKRGAESIMPIFFRDKKIFVKTSSSTWADEILLNRKEIIKKINEQVGNNEIIDLDIVQG